MSKEKHREELHNLDEEDHKDLEEHKQPSKFRKVFLYILGLVLVALILSYLIVGFPISDILRGQLESNPLEGNEIELEDFSIIFEDQTEEVIQQYYLNEQKVEFSLCLQGEKREGNYYINALYQPVTYESTFNHVRFQPCSQETLILFHSHPYKSCLASETDLNTLADTRKENPDVLMVVMCETARFSVY